MANMTESALHKVEHLEDFNKHQLPPYLQVVLKVKELHLQSKSAWHIVGDKCTFQPFPPSTLQFLRCLGHQLVIQTRITFRQPQSFSAFTRGALIPSQGYFLSF